jgi:multiple sugar transport system permease protein
MKKKSLTKQIFGIYLPLAIILIFLLFPFYWTFITSIKTETELYSSHLTYWPKTVSWEAYQKLFLTTVDFGHAMKNSMIVAIGTTLLALFCSTLASYAFCRYEFAGRKF